MSHCALQSGRFSVLNTRAEWEVHVQDLAPVDIHFEVVDEPSVGPGLDRHLRAGASGDGGGVFVRSEHVSPPGELHAAEHVCGCSFRRY